jgi:hypothetical protein
VGGQWAEFTHCTCGCAAMCLLLGGVYGFTASAAVRWACPARVHAALDQQLIGHVILHSELRVLYDLVGQAKARG